MTNPLRILFSAVICGILFGAFSAFAQQQKAEKPPATYENVAYGEHERHVLDFYKAEAASPTPLVVYIHGGGFTGGSKNGINAATLKQLLGAGISVAAIHYRFVQDRPLPAAHHDSRRALQFLRSKAKAWNVDKTRVGAYGGSAGAQICMWLAFHDEMADPASSDPLARESTRLSFVATSGGQTTMDITWWMENIPGYTEPHRSWSDTFGTKDPRKMAAMMQEIAAQSLISADDPPIFMSYGMAPDAPVPAGGRARGWKIHHVNFGIRLKEQMDALGVEADLKYPGATPAYASTADFFIRKFGKSAPVARP